MNRKNETKRKSYETKGKKREKSKKALIKKSPPRFSQDKTAFKNSTGQHTRKYLAYIKKTHCNLIGFDVGRIKTQRKLLLTITARTFTENFPQEGIKKPKKVDSLIKYMYHI